MKKITAFLITLMMVIGLCACSSGSTSSDSGTESTDSSSAAKEITIRFFNGDTELGSITAYENQPVTGYEQFENQEGYEFQGWYKTPTFLTASYRDLTTAVFTDDTKLFGSFKSMQVAEDTRSWYIVGEGSSPVLAASGWAGSGVDDASREACRLQPTGNAVNEYAITLDLFEGDKFQLIYDWQWTGQKGWGLFTSVEDGCFENGGGLSGENDTSNVVVLKDGSYTITLTTDPDDYRQDTVTVVRVGDPTGAAAVQEETVYVVNDATAVVMKGSWVADWSENIELTRVEGTALFTGSKELEAGTELYFMIWDGGADTGIGMNSTAVTDEASKALLEEAYNIKVAEAGTYTFTVDAEARTITITR